MPACGPRSQVLDHSVHHRPGLEPTFTEEIDLLRTHDDERGVPDLLLELVLGQGVDVAELQVDRSRYERFDPARSGRSVPEVSAADGATSLPPDSTTS